MGRDFAKFMATTANKIVFGDKDVELKLTIPHKVAQQNLEFLTSSLNKEIHVILGDPQGSLDFGEDEDAMYLKYTGRYVTADRSGVVTKVEKPEGQEEDENQQKLFDQGSEQGDGSDGVKQDGDFFADGPESEEPAGGEQPDEPGKEEPGLSEDVPEWMKEGSTAEGGKMEFSDEGQQDPEGGASAEDDAGGEIDFTGSGGGQAPNVSEDELTDYEREIMGESKAEISKEQLEEYILRNRPTCPELDSDLEVKLDFPTLLEKRRSGETWMGISREIGVPSGQLTSKFRKYKDYVKKIMTDGGAA